MDPPPLDQLEPPARFSSFLHGATIARELALPTGVIFTPFAPLPPGTPVVDAASSSRAAPRAPLRCLSCGAFATPWAGRQLSAAARACLLYTSPSPRDS